MTSRRLLSLLVAVLALLSVPAAVASGDAATATATATIRGRLQMPDGTAINTTRVTLNDGQYSTYSQADGTFTLYNVGPGIHALNAHNPTQHFATVKIQLLPDSMDSPRCIEYAYAGATKQSIDHPLVLTALARYQYFEPRPRFSPLRILKNPMMLMMIVSVGVMLLMPKMMEGLDDEQKEQMRQQMDMQNKMVSDPTKAFSQLFGGEEEAGPSASEQRRIASSKAGGKTARRGKRD
eukprot:CAMPEP_0178703044 /NCGR_PEP_ID=MMETSP0699-20121125/13273_1 /TAXON_ID=265572 /ORGANISM="Extubocellulus spinifer, Strain CCMP396" /LENGTH=236 /DNA_ID=CAMNT_0020349971 /DNA_START=28 /DNA_END=738 /DNA_ORIENTATION=-